MPESNRYYRQKQKQKQKQNRKQETNAGRVIGSNLEKGAVILCKAVRSGLKEVQC